jgi:hypothetical protein
MRSSKSFGRKRSHQGFYSRENFFKDLSYRGNKAEKQSFYDAQRLEKEMSGCTFKPEVNPLP